MTRSLHISDDGSLHRYRTEIPNTMVRGKRGKGLSLNAKWLYVYLKSVAGDTQECWQSTTTLAEGSDLSRMSVSRARQELARHGLIVLIPGHHKNRDALHIRMVDIWAENMQEFSAGPAAGPERHETVSGPQSTTEIHQCTTQVHQQVVDIPENSYSGVPHRYSGVPHRYSGVPVVAPKKIPIRRSQEEYKENPLLSDCHNRTDARTKKYPPGFERFWETWPEDSPRKDKKFYCFGLWKKHSLESRSAEICAKVEGWKQTQKWRDGYEPQPSTWLNKRQFDDDVPGPQARHRKGEHAGHRIANYPSGKYCKDCQREVLPRELAV